MVDMFEGVRDETISHADMEYWFRDNPEDIIKERFVETLEEIPNTDFTVRNEAWDSVRPFLVAAACTVRCLRYSRSPPKSVPRL